MKEEAGVSRLFSWPQAKAAAANRLDGVAAELAAQVVQMDGDGVVAGRGIAAETMAIPERLAREQFAANTGYAFIMWVGGRMVL